MNIKKYKKISKDFLMNFIASILVTVILQCIVYPFLAYRYTPEKYGSILVIVGIINIAISSFGNTLNNTRLIENKSYYNNKIEGDFNPLIAGITIFSAVIICLILKIFFSEKGLEGIFITIFCGIGIMRAYYIVDFRLNLNFKKQIITNIYLVFGYILGGIVCFISGYWALIFLFGEMVSIVYVFTSSNLKKEKWVFTEKIKNTIKIYSSLTLMSLLGNVIVYFDRLLLYPLLGAAIVSIYSVASFWGKSLGVFFEPIANVLLSYFTQNNFKFSSKNYVSIFILSVCISIIFGLIGIIMAPMVLQVLYPLLINEAKDYIFIATIANVINVSFVLIRPAVLTICNKQKLLIIQLLYCVIYIISTFSLSNKFGLNGFCIGILVANIFNTLALFFYGFKTINYKKKLK